MAMPMEFNIYIYLQSGISRDLEVLVLTNRENELSRHDHQGFFRASN